MTETRSIPHLETVSVGRPVTRLGTSFFPLYLHANGLPEIATGRASELIIEELAHASVPTLSVHNPGKLPVLIVEGEQFEGGLQNRTVNVTILIAPGTMLKIPVSCVEAGRWGRRRAYRRGADFAPQNVRHRVQESVSESVRREGSRFSDQRAVWEAVDTVLEDVDVASATRAVSDASQAFSRSPERLHARQELVSMGPLPQQCGVAFAHGPWVSEIQMFGAPHLLAEHWGALVGSHMLSRPLRRGRPSATGVLAVLDRFGSLPAKHSQGVGLGTEHRVRDEWGSGQALSLNGALLHGTYYTAKPASRSARDGAT